MMEERLGHPDLAGVKHVERYCLYELPFYERWGSITHPFT